LTWETFENWCFCSIFGYIKEFELYLLLEEIIWYSFEVTIELGKILLFVKLPDIIKGFDKLDKLTLNGWIVFWSMEEILRPGGMTRGDNGYYMFEPTFMPNFVNYYASSIFPKLPISGDP
jgi:hypothetical protein